MRRWSYIREINSGKFYLLENTEEAKFGFFVYNDDRSADGGFGLVDDDWEYVKASQVPTLRRKELSWIKNESVDEEIEA